MVCSSKWTDEIEGVLLTQEFTLHWTCRDENLIKYITYEYEYEYVYVYVYEYFHLLAEKATRKGGDASDNQGVHRHIRIHRTGPDRTGLDRNGWSKD